ncbi:putative metal-dependent HD superfamily phosphohydrolase [Paraburkholderia youngii]
MSHLQERFVELWTRCGGARAEAVYADLAQRYSEPIRHYHTLRHVRRCLRYFDAARSAIPHPDLVELALWCHDIIYVPGASDNERRSADWLRRSSGDRIAMCERICAMILATRHTGAPEELDERFTCDITPRPRCPRRSEIPVSRGRSARAQRALGPRRPRI